LLCFTAGKLDNATYDMMKKPRCGVKDKFDFDDDDGSFTGNRTANNGSYAVGL
jgi:phage/plasmid primase-like uncharacterized protein